MEEPDPVGGVHFLFDIPGDDEVLPPAQGELIRGGSEGRAAIRRDQVRVAVRPLQAHCFGCPARPGPPGAPTATQVLWSQRVAHVWAAPPDHQKVLSSRGGGHRGVRRRVAGGGIRARMLWAGTGRKDRCGQRGPNDENPDDKRQKKSQSDQRDLGRDLMRANNSLESPPLSLGAVNPLHPCVQRSSYETPSPLDFMFFKHGPVK